MNRSEWPLRAGSLLLAAGLLLAWEAACRALHVPALVLPPPAAAIRRAGAIRCGSCRLGHQVQRGPHLEAQPA